MKKWLRRIRGALGMGLTWAAAWSGLGAMLGLAWGAISGSGLALGFVSGVLAFAVIGFIGGSAFSVVLGLAEGRRTFDEMSLPRFAGWGAVGGLLLFVLLFMVLGEGFWLGTVAMAGVVALIGAGSAAGSLALARKAGPLLGSGERVGVLEGESPQ